MNRSLETLIRKSVLDVFWMKSRTSMDSVHAYYLLFRKPQKQFVRNCNFTFGKEMTCLLYTSWEELKVLLKREIDNGGVLDADQEVVSSIVSHKPGYICLLYTSRCV